MSPLGDYKSDETDDFESGIEPVKFILDNWPLLGEIAQLSPPPEIVVLTKNNELSEFSSKGFCGLVVASFRRHSKVFIHPHNLMKATENFDSDIAGLWAIAAASMRVILFQDHHLTHDQLLNIESARTGGFTEHKIDTILKQLGRPESDSCYFHKLDRSIIYNAVYEYFFNMESNEFVNQETFRRLVRAEKDDIIKGYFT